MNEAYLRLKGIVSELVSMPIRHVHENRIRRGELLSVPLSFWGNLPSGVLEWANYRVFHPSEELAWGLVESHENLGALCQGKRNSWALSPSTRLFLWKLLESRRPSHILDMGSGVSSLILGTYAYLESQRKGKAVSICSVEHDPEWYKCLSADLVSMGLDRFVDLRLAPLTEQKLLGRSMKAYGLPEGTLESKSGEDGFDLCLIDGPPGSVGRAGSLAIAADYLATDSLVLLDDAYREGEQIVLKEWCDTWPELSKPRLYLADRHGVAMMSWRRQMPELRREHPVENLAQV